jgi:hypothetical protein
MNSFYNDIVRFIKFMEKFNDLSVYCFAVEGADNCKKTAAVFGGFIVSLPCY